MSTSCQRNKSIIELSDISSDQYLHRFYIGMETLITILIVLLASWNTPNVASPDSSSVYFDVTKYGARGDGISDDSQALKKAWTLACWSRTNAPVVYVPKGKKFFLKPIEFKGPCKPSIIIVQITGEIVAPNNIGGWGGDTFQNWIVFSKVDGLSVIGTGRIDGRGYVWWPKAHSFKEKPSALAFNSCHKLKLDGLTIVNSPSGHISITRSNAVQVSNVFIYAPQSSPNTDGIDITYSVGVQIYNSKIATGDDCIAISDGSSFVYVTNIDCGPGHGISIGSLGRDGRTSIVEEVHVKNCTLRGTTNGARIKTWQGGSGHVSKISYENISLIGAANPIIIDQYYCPDKDNCQNQTSTVEVSDVTFNRIYGTTSSKVAINLSCSESSGCTNLVLSDINIKSEDSETVTSAFCINARGRSTLSLPPVNCLLP